MLLVMLILDGLIGRHDVPSDPIHSIFCIVPYYNGIIKSHFCLKHLNSVQFQLHQFCILCGF